MNTNTDSNAIYYTKFNADANSWSVFERGRLNSFGEPFCHLALVTQEQANDAALNLNAGREYWDNEVESEFPTFEELREREGYHVNRIGTISPSGVGRGGRR